MYDVYIYMRIIYVIEDQTHDWLTDWPEKQIEPMYPYKCSKWMLMDESINSINYAYMSVHIIYMYVCTEFNTKIDASYSILTYCYGSSRGLQLESLQIPSKQDTPIFF